MSKSKQQKFDSHMAATLMQEVHPGSQAILEKFNLTMAELKEYSELQAKVYGKKKGTFASLFVVLDFNNPDHKRLNELSGKVMAFNAWFVSNRRKFLA